MSLATLLLGASNPSDKKKAIDAELDALFRSQLDPPRAASSDCPTAEKKKKKRGADVNSDEPTSKRSKPSLAPVSPSGRRKKSGNDRASSTPGPIPSQHRPPVDLDRSKNSPSAPSDDEEGPPSKLMHETVAKDKPSTSVSKRIKYAPADETKETRDMRTIFIGNLAPDVAAKRPLKKQLHRHILAHVPTAKIESTRFRSVAFQTPTSKLPEANEEGKKDKEPRQHERDRASLWRDARATGEPKADEKKFLSPSQKKKIAFINGSIHSDAGSVHAYIVFAYPTPHERPSNLPPLPPVMDPFEAARLAVEKCNGSIFLDRMLRIDAIVEKSTFDSTSDGTLRTSLIGDPKLTVFVGNLHFASKEEDLRIFFEGVMSAERGLPDAAGSQEEDKLKHWVTRVRIVRDRDTQLGKGFAYVQFSDRTCVDEVLALEPSKLKFAKRKLRVQRCKSTTNAPAKHERVSSEKPTQAQTSMSRGAPVRPHIPKGDPSLGEKLVKLSKEERKSVKAADADRVARRVAKKKARLALAKQDVPLQKVQKLRERVRKTGSAKKLVGTPPKKTNKGRVRSEKSIAKKNTKK